MTQITPDPNRKHRLSVYLSDSELRTFQQALKCSSLNQAEFIRRRILQVTKRRQIPLSQIEIYRRLGLLQQQVEAMISWLEERLRSTEGSGSGSVGGKGVGMQEGQAEPDTDPIRDELLELLHDHVADIRALRAEVIHLSHVEQEQ